jgi:3-oxoacyl-[acyl-carrier protein] reductase
MDLMLTGRSALVLGSTSGLGLAIAEGLASEGARVAFTGRRGDTAREVAQRYPGSIGMELDLADNESVERALELVGNTFDSVDILVLNSGGPPAGSATELTASALEASLRTLVLVQIEIVSRLLPGMRARRWGRIVGIGSSGLEQPIPGLVQSNAARAALDGYLKTLSREVGTDGVTVNMVLPGRIDTDRVTQLDGIRARSTGTDAASVRAQAEQSIPVGRYGTPEEFASMAVFLCSDKASYVTGTHIRVDGGLVSSY